VIADNQDMNQIVVLLVVVILVLVVLALIRRV
jgi:hypothetical protein